MNKVMFHEGLSTLMFEASKELKESLKRHKDAEKVLYNHTENDNLAELAQILVDTKKDLEAKAQRLYELVLVDRTVKELEAKGVEI